MNLASLGIILSLTRGTPVPRPAAEALSNPERHRLQLCRPEPS
jgi:hypothetical protein